MEKHLVVMFPDYRGEASNGTFTNQLLAHTHQAVFIPVINGLAIKEAMIKQSEYRNLTGSWLPIITRDKGLLGTLYYGYRFVSSHFPNSLVVRLDTAEHPPAYIRKLQEAVQSGSDLAIGDLSFDKSTLQEGSGEELIHLDIFPAMYRQFTGGQLALSCANGFQGFAPGSLKKILNVANLIVDEVQHELGTTISWGFDGVMALAAVKLGLNIKVIRIPAETPRDRQRTKIAQQFDNTLRLLRAAQRINLLKL